MSQQFPHIFANRRGFITRSCPYTPQHNEANERKNRHLLDIVRSLLLELSVLGKFWPEALATVVHLIFFPPLLSHQSPYYILFNAQRTYAHLLTFGCVCFVHLPSSEWRKLSAQSAICAFLGYSSHQKGFLCYDCAIRCIRVYRNVIFFENHFFFSNNNDSFPSFSLLPNFVDGASPPPLLVYERRRPKDVPQLPSSMDHSPPLDPLPVPDPPALAAPIQLRRSICLTHPPDRYLFTHTSLLATLSTIAIPNSYSHATKHYCWKKATKEELDAL